jgi:hypothetical protein
MGARGRRITVTRVTCVTDTLERRRVVVSVTARTHLTTAVIVSRTFRKRLVKVQYLTRIVTHLAYTVVTRTRRRYKVTAPLALVRETRHRLRRTADRRDEHRVKTRLTVRIVTDNARITIFARTAGRLSVRVVNREG